MRNEIIMNFIKEAFTEALMLDEEEMLKAFKEGKSRDHFWDKSRIKEKIEFELIPREVPVSNLDHNVTGHKKKKGTSSRYKGVSWNKQKKKWHAYIKKDYKLTYLGCSENELDCALMYDVACVDAYGEERAVTNKSLGLLNED